MPRCFPPYDNGQVEEVCSFLDPVTSMSAFEDVSGSSEDTIAPLTNSVFHPDLTKYDCSSADVNPIGSVSKTDLKRFIAWSAKSFNMPILEEFIHATRRSSPALLKHDILTDYSYS